MSQAVPRGHDLNLPSPKGLNTTTSPRSGRRIPCRLRLAVRLVTDNDEVLGFPGTVERSSAQCFRTALVLAR